jgi:gamma-glutamyltranspeptidase
MFFRKNIVCLALIASSFLPVYAYPTHEAKNMKGGVASESEICTQIGIDAIKGGGTAADAMVATVLCVGVTGMYHSG